VPSCPLLALTAATSHYRVVLHFLLTFFLRPNITKFTLPIHPQKYTKGLSITCHGYIDNIYTTLTQNYNKIHLNASKVLSFQNPLSWNMRNLQGDVKTL